LKIIFATQKLISLQILKEFNISKLLIVKTEN